MQNQKKYQQFHDQQDIPRGIPVGIPVRNPMQNQHYNPPQPQPYFQQNQSTNQVLPPQNMGIYAPQAPQVMVPPLSTRIYDHSVQIQCQCCKMNVQTVLSHESGNVTYLWGAAICCFVGQCCCLPWLFNSCLDKVHYCPNCGQSILRKHAKCLEIIN